MYRIALLALLALPLVASAQPGTHQVKLNGHTFTLPTGFTIEVAVGADLAPRPIACDFDEKGRLYVTDSSGSNDKVVNQVKDKPHRIVRLESTKGDGKFDKQTVFVKNVMFPEGCMWLNGSLYVAAPPHIWKFTDTNDDGVADKEEIWFDGKTLTGCANDLHGPYRGPDGYIYWTKGAFAKQEHTLPNGKKFATRASHIFRAKPDGTGIEPVMTGGMDNPVDLVFTPSGDIVFSTTFFQHPRDGKRDGLIHAVYGGVYGKDHDVVYEHPWTSPTLMPVLTHMGPAAPCGLHRYESDQFGKDFADNIFACQFNLRKVSRHVLVRSGSTYETKDSDFVVSDNIDFHPTDVIEDADGSLLIVDTGGWYKLCCPTSQLVKPDVTGAIYRVRKVGAHKIDDPRGLRIDWKAKPEDLANLLGDPRPAVRQRAIESLASRGNSVVPLLLSTASAPNGSQWRTPAVIEALTRVDSPAAREGVRKYLTVADSTVRHRALHSASLWRDAGGLSGVTGMVLCLAPQTRRIAAEAAGRIGDAKVIPTIFTVLAHEENDRALDHALTYALIEIADAKEVAKGLTHDSPRVRRACLAALSNISDSGLDAKTVLAELDAKDSALRDTAWWIAARHPQWGDALAGYFTDKLKRLDKMTPPEQDELALQLVKFANRETIQKTIAAAAGQRESVVFACHVMQRSGLKAMPSVWATALAETISKNPGALMNVLAVYRVLPATNAEYEKLRETIRETHLSMALKGMTPEAPADYGLHLEAATPPGVRDIWPTAFDEAIAVLRDEKSSTGTRALAVEVLARNKLSSQMLVDLARLLADIGPVELSKVIALFDKSRDEKVGLTLVSHLRSARNLPRVRAEMVKLILDKYPKAVKDGAEKLYAELAEARKGETQRLEKLLTDMKPGDIRRGQLVFNSTKTNCIACHKVGYVGGLAGPDLTRIGGIRTERDLLESIIFPSASFVRSYEPVRVVTKDDRTLNGVLKKDAPDEIIVVTAADKEERVSRADIESISPSTVSLMPAGMEQQLTPQELADLIAFLKACK
jgi:putative membrane-bound dehydrogenase-like protein